MLFFLARPLESEARPTAFWWAFKHAGVKPARNEGEADVGTFASLLFRINDL